MVDVCSSLTAVLGFSFASLTILTVRGDNMHLRILLGKFATVRDVWFVVCLTVYVFFLPIT